MVLSGSFAPGELAVWHSGSSAMSWPPDGHGSFEHMITPHENTLVLIVARVSNHGAIVLTPDHGMWWCNLSSLRGEPSGSAEVKW